MGQRREPDGEKGGSSWRRLRRRWRLGCGISEVMEYRFIVQAALVVFPPESTEAFLVFLLVEMRVS